MKLYAIMHIQLCCMSASCMISNRASGVLVLAVCTEESVRALEHD